LDPAGFGHALAFEVIKEWGMDGALDLWGTDARTAEYVKISSAKLEHLEGCIEISALPDRACTITSDLFRGPDPAFLDVDVDWLRFERLVEEIAPVHLPVPAGGSETAHKEESEHATAGTATDDAASATDTEKTPAPTAAVEAASKSGASPPGAQSDESAVQAPAQGAADSSPAAAVAKQPLDQVSNDAGVLSAADRLELEQLREKERTDREKKREDREKENTYRRERRRREKASVGRPLDVPPTSDGQSADAFSGANTELEESPQPADPAPGTSELLAVDEPVPAVPPVSADVERAVEKMAPAPGGEVPAPMASTAWRQHQGGCRGCVLQSQPSAPTTNVPVPAQIEPVESDAPDGSARRPIDKAVKSFVAAYIKNTKDGGGTPTQLGLWNEAKNSLPGAARRRLFEEYNKHLPTRLPGRPPKNNQ
jgi:hypothetical protein